MFCRHCGKKLPDDSQFCVYCGTSVEPTSVSDDEHPAAKQMNTESAEAPVESSDSRAAKVLGALGSRRMLLGIAVAAVVIVVAVGGMMIFQRAEAERMAAEELAREQEERREMLAASHDVTIGVDASGWDTEEGGTPMPVLISGTTAAGEDYEERQFVDSDGEGIELVPGSYALSVEASPFGEYGRMYDYPSADFAIAVDEDLAEGEGIDMSDDLVIELSYPDNLTPDGVERAREIALDAGYDVADDLADRAHGRYFDEDEEDEDESDASSANTTSTSKSGTNVRTYEGDFFDIELPVAWDIRVASGGGDLHARHTVSLEGEDILIIDVMWGDEDISGVITDAAGVQKLGVTSDGGAVIAWRGNGPRTSNSMELIEEALETIDIK